MKTLVSAKSKRFNPWLIVGYAAIAIPIALLLWGTGWGWYFTLFDIDRVLNGWQVVIVLWSWLAALIVAGAAIVGVVSFFDNDYHGDIYRWWRKKVENYGKIED